MYSAIAARSAENAKKICISRIISALKATAPKWEFEQINFVVGNRLG